MPLPVMTAAERAAALAAPRSALRGSFARLSRAGASNAASRAPSAQRRRLFRSSTPGTAPKPSTRARAASEALDAGNGSPAMQPRTLAMSSIEPATSAAVAPPKTPTAAPAEPPRPRTAGFLRRSARRDIQRDILATLIGATGAGADAGAGKVTAEFGFSAPSAGEPAGFGDGVEDDDADFAFAPAAGLA